jgi:hypothetical protein
MCKLSFLFAALFTLILCGTTQAAVDVTAPGDTVQGVPNDGDWPADESPPNSIDNNPNTKYLHFKGYTGTTGFRVTPSNTQSTVIGLTFTTANDGAQRDPTAYALSGSNVSIDGPYTLIATGEIVDFKQATEWPRFTKNTTPISFANTTPYNHYQIIFTAIRDPAAVVPMQIAEVELLVPQLTAWGPTPSDGAINQAKSILRWSPGDTAVAHDVYFGTDRTAVENADASSPECIELGKTELYSIAAVALQKTSTTYYWRIDEVEDGDTIYKGDIWSFTTAPMKAHSPNPADGEVIVDPKTALSWGPGFNVKSSGAHIVYFGTDETAVANANTSSPECKKPAGQSGKTWTTGLLANDKSYYWRIDEKNKDYTVTKGDVWSFTTPPPGLGTILRELWLNITPTGTTLSLLRNWPWYPDYPDQVDELTSFDSPSYGDSLEQFGGRIHGWLYPPRTGDYTFYLATDDNGELWLSTDENPVNAQLIAYEDSSGDKAWEYGNERSAPIALQAGKRYYISALWKEDTGDDNCAVGWTGPGISTITVIPGSVLMPMPYVRLLAQNPSPRNNTTMVPNTVALTWTPGDNAASHKVWFGTDPNAMELVATKPLGDESYDPGPLEFDTTYYWRIDEVNDTDPDSPWTGRLWRFSTIWLGGDPNLIGWWTFDEEEGAGALVLDWSGYGNDGTIIGGAQRVPAMNENAGNAISLNGGGQNVAIANFDEIIGAGGVPLPEISIAMWARPYTVSEQGMMWFTDGPNPSYGKIRCRIDGGRWQFSHVQGENGNNVDAIGPAAVAGEWAHYVGVRRDNDALYVYINGELGGSAAFTRAEDYPPEDSASWIGSHEGNLYYFVGLIDDVRVYNRALSQAEVRVLSACYEATNPSPPHGNMVDADAVALTWTPGTYAVLHDVYFSDNFDDVNTATTSSGGVYKGRQSELKYPPGPFDTIPVTWGETYYWRIDEVNDTNPDSPWTGRLWRFTTIGLGDDCNGNGIPDECDIANGTSLDCNRNGIPDECDIANGTSLDCNGNGIPDECDIAAGTSHDVNGDGVPDECQIDARVVPVVTLIDPASTTEVRTTLPNSIEAVVRGGKYYLEVWASDTGAIKTGLTGVYVDISFCGQTSASNVEHGTVFTMFTAGDIQPGGVNEFGGSTFAAGVGAEPNWVRIGWIEMSAVIDAPTCSISLLPSTGGVAAYGQGLVPWAFIGLGSVDLQILPPARSYNLDGDSVIGVGDLSLFVPSWQQSVPPAQNAHDFDCDCFVGVGDLSWFATGWLKSPADPTILYPPCPGGGNCGKVTSMDSIAPRGFTLSSLHPTAKMSGTPADIDVAFELVVLNAPSASATTIVLPISIGSITQGQTYYVEVWVSDVGNISTGITSAYVDLHFPAAAASVTNISHGSIFTLFPSGSVAVGVIDELGGSQLSPGVGVAPQWARVAVIRMRADAVPPLVTFSLSPSSTKVASYGRGVVDWDDITLGIASVPPKITGFVRTPRGRGVNGVLLSADNGGGSGLTDTAGYYEVVVPQGWSGTVTPISAEFSLSFDPDALSYGNVTNVLTNQNYVARNICDLNDDDKVSIVDFAYFADYWLKVGVDLPANFDLSGAVGYTDLEIFIQNWLWTP